MARRSGAIGGGSGRGALLDQLVVKIDVDLSGLQRGIAQAVAEIRTLQGAIAGQIGGVSLGDAMQAALVAPLAVATARIGQMRNEVRALTQEMRGVVPLLTSGGPATGGRSAGAVVPYVAPGVVLDAQRRVGVDGRPVVTNGSRGRFTPIFDIDDGVSDSAALAAGAAVASGGDGFIDDAAAGAAGAAVGGRRRRNWFQRTFSPSRSRRAFDVAQREFPGYGDAADNLGVGANRVGQGMRRGAGGRIAAMLGLTGLGALFGDLVGLAASLATVLSGTLAGAFAALATPLGLVVAGVTALVGLFVAANWDQFREFGEWFASRWREIVGGEGMADVVNGWNNLTGAFRELWSVVAQAFRDDSGSIGVVLQGFGELIIRVVNAALEILGALLNTIAELVRAVAALIAGDWQGAWEHFGQAVQNAFRGALDAIGSLIPEVQEALSNFADWVVERFQAMGGSIASAIRSGILGGIGGASQGASGSDSFWGGWRGAKSAAANDNKGGARGKSLVIAGPLAGVGAGAGAVKLGPSEEDIARIERAERAADAFATTVLRGFENGIASGAKFSDILKQIIVDLVTMVVRSTMLGPLEDMFRRSVGAVFTGGGGKGGGGWMSAAVNAVGSFFGGFFADGGFLQPGKWGIVGERGPEIVFGGRTGASVFAGANDNMRVDARTYVDARGADSAAIARVEAALAQHRAELPVRIRAQVGDMRQRGRL